MVWATMEDTWDARRGLQSLLPNLLLLLLLIPMLIPTTTMALAAMAMVMVCMEDTMVMAMVTMGDTMDTPMPMEDTTLESKKDLECQINNDDLPNVLSQFLKMYKIKNT